MRGRVPRVGHDDTEAGAGCRLEAIVLRFQAETEADEADVGFGERRAADSAWAMAALRRRMEGEGVQDGEGVRCKPADVCLLCLHSSCFSHLSTGSTPFMMLDPDMESRNGTAVADQCPSFLFFLFCFC